MVLRYTLRVRRSAAKRASALRYRPFVQTLEPRLSAGTMLALAAACPFTTEIDPVESALAICASPATAETGLQSSSGQRDDASVILIHPLVGPGRPEGARAASGSPVLQQEQMPLESRRELATARTLAAAGTPHNGGGSVSAVSPLVGDDRGRRAPATPAALTANRPATVIIPPPDPAFAGATADSAAASPVSYPDQASPLPPPPAGATREASFVENFDDNGPVEESQFGPQNLIDRGWIFRMQSSPPSSQAFYDGYPNFISPQSGSGYLAADAFMAFSGPVSNWAILPTVANQVAGDPLALWLNRLGALEARLEIRYSPSGGTSTGTTPSDVGDFTQRLLNVDPIPAGGWERFSVDLPGDGRIALRFSGQYQSFSGGMYSGIDTLSVGAEPPPGCNLPPIPSAGQTVTWTAANSPYQICENVGIPAGANVQVEPGVEVNFDADRELTVAGTLNADGTSGSHITFMHPAVFPPMITVNGGTLNAAFTDFGGQVRPGSGANLFLSDCGFAGNGMLTNFSQPAVAPYVRLERCTFRNTNLILTDTLAVLKNNTVVNTYSQILRGFADVTAPNTFTGQPLRIVRQSSIQPLYVEGVQASGVANGGGLLLDGGSYLLGENNILQRNLHPLDLRGGLMPGSTVPLMGNRNNAINVGDAGFAGIGRWPNFGLPYHVTEQSGTLPGGQLTIDPGVNVEFAPDARLIIRSTRRVVADGLPGAPITFSAIDPAQGWTGIVYATNDTEGPRLEYCNLRDADFGVIATDSSAYVQNCTFQGNDVGANTNTFGNLYISKTQFLDNGTGVSHTDLGSPTLYSPTNPNSFEGNGVAMNAFEPGSSADARNVWWGHPTGPQHPQNPGGQGDAVVGPGAINVNIFPFLTAPPNFTNTPPVVRLVEPGLAWNTTFPPPDFLAENGSKIILHWDVQDADAITSQRVLFSPDGHYPDRFEVVATLPPGQRSFEWTAPTPGFAVTNQPQFLRVVAVDAAGQEGWDQTPLVVPSGRCTGNLTIDTNLTGQTIFAGQPLPDISWSGSTNEFCTTVTPHIVLEADGQVLSANGFGQFPAISTDSARLALRALGNSNDVAWFFAPGYFSIRHDPRLGLKPPTIQLALPQPGASYPGGSVVPIKWRARDDEGLYSFDIQGSYDSGRTWHLIVKDLPGTARSFDWQLPPSGGIADVRVRVIARDIRYQNNSAGADRVFSITTGRESGFSGTTLRPDMLPLLTATTAMSAPSRPSRPNDVAVRSASPAMTVASPELLSEWTADPNLELIDGTTARPRRQWLLSPEEWRALMDA